MNAIKIIQHNVQSWGTRKFELSNTYKSINPYVILINSYGTTTTKLEGCNTFNKNDFNEAYP